MKKQARRLYFDEYTRAVKRRFPEAFGDASAMTDEQRERLAWLRGSVAQEVLAGAQESAKPDPHRYQKPTERKILHLGNAWLLSSFESRFTARVGYRGLLNIKPASDLVLYSNLIWELQPRTILEFGALQGGSGLWLADQLDALSPRGRVHSFDFDLSGVSARAKHKRLAFHEVDLRDLGTLDRRLLARAPHPWLVIDDAHTNIGRLFALIDEYMVNGDYYVIEDSPSMMGLERLGALMRVVEQLGYRVDSHYTDAFGYNMTCAPNAWLRKAARTAPAR